MLEFDQFWGAFPRKVGKLAALRAYERSRRLASAEDIIAGVERYKQTKPDYADWCHPATWLNQGRWMDEPDLEPVKADIHGHVPPCRTWGECTQKVLDEARKAKVSA